MSGVRRLTGEEVKLMLAKANHKTKLLVIIGVSYGTRVSESLELTFGDFADDRVTIKGKKHGMIQSYPVTSAVSSAVSALKKWYESKDIVVTSQTPLFLGADGKAMTRQAASARIKRLARKLKINGRVNTHSLRKAFVTEIYERTNKDLAKTRLYSRHKSLSNLQYYIDSGVSTDIVDEINW